MSRTRTILCGAFLTLVARSLLNRIILEKFRGDVRKLNSGDYSSLLSMFADDAVIHFNEGEHRWAGEHRGKPAIERFLRDFTGAGMQAEIGRIWTSGPLWAMTMAARLDDHSNGPDGEEIYSNRVVAVIRIRWGKIVEQYDFYEDTGRIADFEARLIDLGIEPV